MKTKFKETFLYHLLQLLKFEKRDYFYQIHDFDSSEHEHLLDHYLGCPFEGAGFIDHKRYEVISCEIAKTTTKRYIKKYNYYKKIIDDKRELEDEINELNKKKKNESK